MTKITSPHNLSDGDIVLLADQLTGNSATFMFAQTGIVAENVKIEAWMTTDNHPAKGMPFTRIDDATLTITPGRLSDYITLNGYGRVFVEYRLVANGVTVGSIDKTDINQDK